MARILKLVIAFLALVGATLAVAAFLFVYPKYREYQRVADSFDLAELDNIPAISEVFDYAGLRYSKLEGQVRYVVPLSQISPNFINALMAREDARFYKHRGVDLTGIARAAMRRGCVCPIIPSAPRPASRQIFGSCVVLPEPVAPQTTIS